MSNQRKLVDALKAFMEKGVIPILGDGHPSLNEWKFLSGILSSEKIDSSQLDFYIHMSNKASNSGIKSTQSPTQKSGNSFPVTVQTNSSFTSQPTSTKPKMSFAGDRRKQLLSNMQSFHGTMVRNQQKLQTFNKKGSNTSNALNVSTSTGYAIGSKKYI